MYDLVAECLCGADGVVLLQEAELSTWTAFLQRAVDATYNSEVVIDNLHNMIAEQRRYVREVSNSNVFVSLCAESASDNRSTEERDEQASAVATPAGGAGGAGDTCAGSGLLSPPARRPPSAACSTPIAKD
ncbi:hypothetical protein O0L34_g18062 [Tuta absoluta]|nr:hypothetical protein O0L34_g18062 [Tuta absoluta]